jgi:hypothetical protein
MPPERLRRSASRPPAPAPGRVRGRHYDLPIAMTIQRSHDAEDGNRHTFPGSEPGEGEGDRIGQLRGASVQIDPRRIVAALTALVMVTLAVLAVVLTVAGLHQNQQIDRLRQHGVPVTVTVTGCLGLLGGSGSNAAGYSCRGTYSLSGHRYTESLPGNAFHRPGDTVRAVAVPGDPALVSPLSVLDREHSSGGVYVLPAVLTAVLLALVALVLWRRRPARTADGTVPR